MQKDSLIHTLVLGLGSNQGDSKSILENAYCLLQFEIGKTVSISSFYSTQPWGNPNQPDFLNAAMILETQLSPQDCLLAIQQIENKLGRIRNEKWGIRTIDIDVLFYDNLILKQKNITIPHPEIENRNFVLHPLEEICPDFKHPILKKSISELLLLCNDTCEIKKIVC